MKGKFYYEWQIVMFVFMWQHDMAYKPRSVRGLRWGRLHVWYDTAWKNRGIASRVRSFFEDLTEDVSVVNPISSKFVIMRINAKYMWKKFWFRRRIFWTRCGSLWNFYRLWRAGFDISRSSLSGLTLHRFFWNGHVMHEFPDIDEQDGQYTTVLKGIFRRLP